MTLTAAIRDLHKTYPGRFQTGIRTRHPDIWLHNPYITPLALGQGNRVYVHYDRIRHPGERRFYSKGIDKKAAMGLHMISGYRDYISAVLGLDIPATSPFPDLHFSQEELNESPIPGEYWVVFAGGKHDYTNKIWDTTKYQGVVDLLSDVKFVQVGAKRDQHPPLRGVTNLVGRTSLRELIVLIKHARGVICPITCGLHIAAGCGTPCIVIAGGREPPCWERYPGQTYIHTIGKMDCCATGGCFKNRADLTANSDCRHLVRGDTIPQAACMHAIQPEHVETAVRAVQAGTPLDEIVVDVPKYREIQTHRPETTRRIAE